MTNKIEDMTLQEILYDLQEETEIELLNMINSTASDAAIKDKLEILALIRYIRNEDWKVLFLLQFNVCIKYYINNLITIKYNYNR